MINKIENGVFLSKNFKNNSLVAKHSDQITYASLKNPLVSIIVLNYNGQTVLKDCLDSICKSTYSNYEIIVVDNNSKDGSEKIALENHSCRLLTNHRNLGYCGGNNVGIEQAKGEFIVLINNDTAVHPDWLTCLVQTALSEHADFCQPKILLSDGKTLNSIGLDIHIAGFGLLRGLGEIDNGQHDNSHAIQVFGCHGACIFVSRSAIKKIGVLDNTFFAFNDDTDWSWRALLKNLKMLYVPSAIIYHKWTHSFSLKNPKKFHLLERNRIIMILTNYSKRSIVLLSPIFALTELATFAYCLQGRQLLKAKINCYSDLLCMRRYIQIRRKLIQESRLVPDEYIIRKFRIYFNHNYLVTNVNVVNQLYKLIWKIISRSF